MSQRTVTTCDKCKEDIADKEDFVDAGVYGYQFHLGCLAPQNVQMLIMLGLDEIKYAYGTGDTEKLIYSQWAKAHANNA